MRNGIIPRKLAFLEENWTLPIPGIGYKMKYTHNTCKEIFTFFKKSALCREFRHYKGQFVSYYMQKIGNKKHGQKRQKLH